MAKGTLRIRARVRASRVLPQPVGPIRRMFDLSSSTSLIGVLAVDQPLVVVVHGDREHLLGPVLVDHVGVELFLDLARGGNIGEERLGHAPPPPLLVEDRLAELDALAADVDVARAFDERADVAVALAAERAIGVLLGAARRARGHAAATTLSPASHEPPPVMSLPDGMQHPFIPNKGTRSPRFARSYVSDPHRITRDGDRPWARERGNGIPRRRETQNEGFVA